MLELCQILKAGRTGISPDMWTMLAARKFCSEYQRTSESDYIYSGDTVIFYIGKRKKPQIPQTLSDNQIRIIERTAFAGQNIRAVCIADGTEVIE